MIYSVQCSHNGAINSSTGFSPARIVLGDRFNNPEDILLGTEKGIFKGNIEEMVHHREEDDDMVYRTVRESIGKHQDDKIKKLPSRGSAYRVGDRVRYKHNEDVRNRQGGKIAPRYSKEYEVIEVLGDGFTYKLQAVNHNGRVKDRHFNLLKTVDRLTEGEEGTEDSEDGGDETLDGTHPITNQEIEKFLNAPTSESETVQDSEETGHWVRRSKRKVKKPQLLQADGTKKSYSTSSATHSNNDSE